MGPASCPKSGSTCDHPGCSGPNRGDISAVNLPCGNSFHVKCCRRVDLVRRSPSQKQKIDVGCDRTVSLSEQDSNDLIRLIYTENIQLAVRIYGIKAKELVESPPTDDGIADDYNTTAGVDEDDAEIHLWTSQKCKDAVNRANGALQSLLTSLPPSQSRLAK